MSNEAARQLIGGMLRGFRKELDDDIQYDNNELFARNRNREAVEAEKRKADMEREQAMTRFRQNNAQGATEGRIGTPQEITEVNEFLASSPSDRADIESLMGPLAPSDPKASMFRGASAAKTLPYKPPKVTRGAGRSNTPQFQGALQRAIRSIKGAGKKGGIDERMSGTPAMGAGALMPIVNLMNADLQRTGQDKLTEREIESVLDALEAGQ